MATMYKGNTPLLGGGYGHVSQADNATNSNTAANSLKLNNIAYKDILERQSTFVSSRLSDNSWYQVAGTTGTNNAIGKGGLLILERSYGYNYSESYIFAINCGFDSVDITQLSGIHRSDGHKLTKVRVRYKANTFCYVDVYIPDCYYDNISVTTIGGLDTLSFTKVTDTTGWNIKEFATVLGFKASNSN